jgi:hypothetical protein
VILQLIVVIILVIVIIYWITVNFELYLQLKFDSNIEVEVYNALLVLIPH